MKIKKQEPKQENDYTALLKPVGTRLTAVEWLVKETPNMHWEDAYWADLYNKAKEMEKQQQGYSEEEVENFIRITYEETMKAMVDWFINNKDKSKEEIESAIEMYVYPRLAEKGIKFKNK